MGDMDDVLSPAPQLYGIKGRAAEIARCANSQAIGAEHLFLAMIHDDESRLAQVLERLAGLDRIEVAVRERLNRPDYSPPEREFRNGFPVARWTGTMAATIRGDSYIGVDHVLLEIIRDRETIPARVLDGLGCRDQVEAAVTAAMNAPLGTPADAVFLPEGQQLDGALRLAIIESLPEGTTFAFNWYEGRPWVVLHGPGDTRAVLNTALARLGRQTLSPDGAQG
jgi:hypothetical protein